MATPCVEADFPKADFKRRNATGASKSGKELDRSIAGMVVATCKFNSCAVQRGHRTPYFSLFKYFVK